MPDADDLALLTDAAHAAGEIARRFWNKAPDTWDKPGDGGPVTEADIAVDRMLHAELGAARPDYGWLSEEREDDTTRLAAERVFIVDPIDGTRSFINGELTWAHSLAVAENGRITASVVYLPLRKRLYSARIDAGATCNGDPIGASDRSRLVEARVLAARATYDAPNWRDAQVPAVQRNYRPSLAYRLCLVAEGRFDAMLTLRPTWEWDVAAGALIVAEAGGRVTDRRDVPLRFNAPDPRLNGVVAAGIPLHALLADRLIQL